MRDFTDRKCFIRKGISSDLCFFLLFSSLCVFPTGLVSFLLPSPALTLTPYFLSCCGWQWLE